MVINRIELKNAVALYKKDEKYRERILSYCICDENRSPLKYFDFIMDDDFSFTAQIFEYNLEKVLKMNTLDFEINKDSLLYEPLKNFLGNDKSILIDDDNSIYDDNEKTMEFMQEEDKIKIIFKNIKEKDDVGLSKKFSVFIKNIYHDKRSKIDQGQSKNNTKERLRNLFASFDKVFSNDKDLGDER